MLDEVKQNFENQSAIYINEGTLPILLWKDTCRRVVQARSTDSTSVVVEPNNADLIVAFVLGITSNVNTFDNHNLYSLKNNLPKNENEAIDKPIIQLLIAAITEAKDDQVRTSKRITFG